MNARNVTAAFVGVLVLMCLLAWVDANNGKHADRIVKALMAKESDNTIDAGGRNVKDADDNADLMADMDTDNGDNAGDDVADNRHDDQDIDGTDRKANDGEDADRADDQPDADRAHDSDHKSGDDTKLDAVDGNRKNDNLDDPDSQDDDGNDARDDDGNTSGADDNADIDNARLNSHASCGQEGVRPTRDPRGAGRGTAQSVSSHLNGGFANAQGGYEVWGISPICM